jgi:hypothetical protein
MRDWPEIRVEAERRFLGRNQVVGVAVAEQPSPRLGFFLSEESPAAESVIARWAVDQGVEFDL